MPIDRSYIGSQKWVKSLLHQPKSVLIQLAQIEYDKGIKMSKKDLVRIYQNRISNHCTE